MAQPVATPRAREATSMQPFRFRLDAVQIGTRSLGNGAYAEVREASVPCAAKILHEVLTDPRHPRNSSRFEQECRILGECFHPNIVRFFGVSVNPTTGRTALLMELMTETLTGFLEVRYKDRDKVPYCLQLSISHDIASGVSYLHSKRILHRDLSSNNVLMKCGTECIAKISDFGTSVFNDARRQRLTECPGTAVYMPPEAFITGATSTRYEKMDSFQMGVLMLQIATKKFPSPSDRMRAIPNPQYDPQYDPQSTPQFLYEPISEKKRRENHLEILRNPEHPLLDQPILDCLEDSEKKRPTSKLVCDRLTELMIDIRYLKSCEKEGITPRVMNDSSQTAGDGLSSDLLGNERVLLLQEENQRLKEQLERRERERTEQYEAVKREKLELERQVAELQQSGGAGRVVQLEQANQQFQRLVEVRQTEVQTLQNEKKHLQTLVEVTQRETQTIKHEKLQLGHVNSELVQEIERYKQQFAGLSQQLQVARSQLETQAHKHQVRMNSLKEQETTRFEATINTLRQQLKERCDELERVIPNHTCRAVKGYKTTITANHSTSIEMELCDAAGNPRNISPNTPLRALLFSNTGCDPTECVITPLEKSFKVSHELSYPGQYQLSIQLSNREIYRGAGLSVYPDPRPPAVLVPRRYIESHKKPWSATINQKREIFICEWSGDKVSVYDIDKPGKAKRSLDGPIKPTGVAVDGAGNVYVTSQHMLQKFSSEANTIVGTVGREKGEEDDKFNFPSGVAVFNDEVYVCDQKNGRIQVFNLNLNYARTVVPGDGQLFNDPSDLAFDAQGRMYVTEYSSNRVVVMTTDGQHLQVIGDALNLKPESVHVVDDYVYVSDFNREHDIALAVFHISGKHITSFGRRGDGMGEWLDPRGITSCEGKVYVCGSEDGYIHTLETV